MAVSRSLRLGVSFIFATALTCFGQGSLTPPGGPAPTMKSLDQVKAGTPIASAPYTITTPGNYFLTQNLSVTSGNAITISNVTGVKLDLNGFTISSTEANPTGTGILVSGAVDVIIANGNIKGNVIWDGEVFSGAGFQNGITQGSNSFNTAVSNVNVSGCKLDGINLNFAATIAHCTAYNCGGIGIFGGSVTNCVATNCGSMAVRGATVSHSYGVSVASERGIYADVATDCQGNSNFGPGIDVLTAINCLGGSSSGTGINANTATNSYGGSGSGAGLTVTTATGCYGSSSSNTGISATVAENSYGSSISGVGLDAANNALNCYGNSSANVGLHAGIAAQNCYGNCSGNNQGLVAALAENCYGDSSSQFGLFATIAAFGSYGHTHSGAQALHSNGVASYCSGKNDGPYDAINCTVAIGCSTFGGTITAPQGKFLGTP